MRLAIARCATLRYMDTVPGIEDTMNVRDTKSKTALVPILGVVVGILIGAGTMAFLFRDAVFFNIPTVEETNTISYPDQKVTDLKTNILLPKKLVGEDYYLLINRVVNGLNQVGINNNATLIPIFDNIKQKSTARDFNGIFDLIIQARGEIKKNNDLLATTREDITALGKINDGSITDADIRRQTAVFLTSADTLTQAYTGYFATLSETLSGSIPTQNLLDRLATKVTSLRDSGSSFRSELNALLATIQQKDKTSTP